MTQEDQKRWKTDIRTHREDKIETFESPTESPLSEQARSSFDGLDFFPIAASFRVRGRLEMRSEPTTTRLEATHGPPISFEEVGQVGVEFDSELTVLSVYRAPGVETLLVPFRDGTNGNATWEHGRYLNIPAPETTADTHSKPVETVLDFNVAYHPLCVYDETVRSAIPPTENQLPVSIPAGERL